ncbi:MAG: hypothetical protein ACE5F4_01565 [Candidatus Paceibacteria bacterium]
MGESNEKEETREMWHHTGPDAIDYIGLAMATITVAALAYIIGYINSH